MLLTAVLATVLAGCAADLEPTSEFCEGFESAWTDFHEERDEIDSRSEVTIAARTTLLEEWRRLSELHDQPEDVTDMLVVVSASFLETWNATSDADRSSGMRSLRNGMEYISRSCAQAGHEVVLNEVPVEGEG